MSNVIYVCSLSRLGGDYTVHCFTSQVAVEISRGLYFVFILTFPQLSLIIFAILVATPFSKVYPPFVLQNVREN